MNLKDLKKDIPETPEFIHTMIQNEVKKQLQETKVVEIGKRRVKKWTGARVAAAAAVCVLAVSSIAYAGSRLYHVFVEKQGTYGIVAGIRADEGTGKMNLPEKIHDIDICAGYIPEGMEWMDEIHLQYPERNWMGGFSFSSVLLDKDDVDVVLQDKNVVESEQRTFGSYEGVYLRYHDLEEDGSFNQRIYLLCPDVYRVILIYIGDDVSKEEAFKVAENLIITENETIMETDVLYTWSELVSPEGEPAGEILDSVEEDRLPMHRIGDTFDLSATGEDSNGSYVEDHTISVCVDSVQVTDDLQLLDQNHIPYEWVDIIGEDGKIVKNTLSYIKSGDGIETVDEVVRTESIDQKLVYVAVTYTNNTDQEINHMLYFGTMMLLNHEDGTYQICSSSEVTGEEYDRISGDSVAHAGDMTYYSVTEEYGNGGNYISSLKPGESIQVNMAWIVNENVLDHMYLNLNGDGGAYQFTDSALRSGIVDICQQ